MRRLSMIVACIPIAALAGWVVAGAASQEPDTAPPVGVKAPEPGDVVGVVGPDGNPVKCNGKQLKVKIGEAPRAPAASARATRRRARAAQGSPLLVPRCGADGNAKAVPFSED
jgi:hypothetical protein